MSRTPEKLKNKKAESIRNFLIGVGILFALASFGAYQNGENPIFAALISGAMFFIASKIKVWWSKTHETSIYK